MRISYSQLQDYWDCPYRYKLAHIDKHKKEAQPTPELLFGRVIHSILCQFHSPNLFSAPSLQELLSEFERQWLAQKVENADEYLQEGFQLLKDYYKLNAYQHNRTAKVEHWFELGLDSDNTLVGRLDRVDVLEGGTIEVIDYKTGRVMPSQDIVDKDEQLSVYHLAVDALWKPKHVLLSLYYVHHNYKLTTERTPQTIESLRTRIIDTIKAIEASQFPMKFSERCSSWCDYDRWCPMTMHKYKDEVGLPQAIYEIPIQEIANEYYKLSQNKSEIEHRIEELKKLIHQYLDLNKIECLWADEFVIQRTRLSVPDYDINILKPLLERLGILEQVVKIEASKLNELLKNYKLSEEDLKILNKAKQTKKETLRLSIDKRKNRL